MTNIGKQIIKEVLEEHNIKIIKEEPYDFKTNEFPEGTDSCIIYVNEESMILCFSKDVSKNFSKLLYREIEDKCIEKKISYPMRHILCEVPLKYLVTFYV